MSKNIDERKTRDAKPRRGKRASAKREIIIDVKTEESKQVRAQKRRQGRSVS